MHSNIYHELFRHCDIFSSEMKKSELLKENNHLVVEIEKFKIQLNKIIDDNNIINVANIERVDFSWLKKLEEFISAQSSNTNFSILKSSAQILDLTKTIKKYLEVKSRYSRTQNGSNILPAEDLINSFINLKTEPLSQILNSLLISDQKYNDAITEVVEFRKDFENRVKEMELNFSEKFIAFGLDNSERLLGIKNSIDERISTLADEKLKKAEDIYQKTLALNSLTAGNIISNDFSKSAIREKKWADWLRICGFLVLLFCALVLYTKSDSFTLADPKTITALDYIHLIKTSAVSIFLISLSILCLKESTKHRVQQYFYENQSLKIASLSPLIADIEKEKQESVKQEVAKFLFSMEQKINISDDSSSAFLGMTKILEKLIDKK